VRLTLLISFAFLIFVGLGIGNSFAGEIGATSGAALNTEIQSCDASQQSCKPSQDSDEIAQIKINDAIKFLELPENNPQNWIQCTTDSACGSGHKCCSNHCKAVVTC